MTYPNTSFSTGTVDDPFGGGDNLAVHWGQPQRTFVDNQIREIQTQLCDRIWVPYLTVKSKITTGGIAGDVVVELLASTDPEYTVGKMATLWVSADATPFVGVLAEPCSAGATATVVVGGFVPKEITLLGIGASGYLTYNTTTGRLQAAVLGDPIVGTFNTRGYARLYPFAL